MTDLNDDELADMIQELPTSIEPPEDRWPQLRQALTARRNPQGDRVWPAQSARGLRLLWAAGILLLFIGAGLVARGLRDRPASAGLAQEWEPALQPWDVMPASTSPADLERFRQQVRTIVDEESHTLSPETMAALRRSLAIIDGAIRDLDTALKKDPKSEPLRARLFRAYQAQASLVRLAWQAS
jgi:hypothetical protein